MHKTRILAIVVVATGVAVRSAEADFTFGEAVHLKSTVAVLGPVHEPVNCFSYDELEMYITMNRAGGIGGLDLWVLKRASKGQDWGGPENLGSTVNSGSEDSAGSISGDGLSLYLNSNRPGGYGGYDVYAATRESTNTGWGQVLNIGPNVNSSADDGFPWISPDNLELYFGSHRPGGYGSCDLYVLTRAREDDPWGTAVNLGPTINSPTRDARPSLSPDGLLLFFDSERSGGHGGVDMWMVRRISRFEPWQLPVNLGLKINGGGCDACAHTSPDGVTFHFYSSRSGFFTNWQAPILPICDFNRDGRIDGEDVLCMVSHWGTDDPLCDIAPFAWGDGVVDLQDLVVLAEYIGTEVGGPSPTACWALDETSGNFAYESVSGNWDFVLGGPLWQPTGGIVDGALDLDGIDDCVITSFSLDPSEGPFSIVVWVKGGSPGQVVISEPGIANWLMACAEGKLMTELAGVGPDSCPLTSEMVITDGQWHRIGLVWDGSHRTLCANGVVVAKDTQSAPRSSGNGQYIGTGKMKEPGTFWFGLVDDVRIYNVALSTEKIKALAGYNASVTLGLECNCPDSLPDKVQADTVQAKEVIEWYPAESVL